MLKCKIWERRHRAGRQLGVAVLALCMVTTRANAEPQTTEPTPPEAGQVRAEEAPAQQDLRAKIQNPVGNLYTIPIETTFDFGAPDGEATFIQLQPVYPFRVGDWNLVNRTIIPLIDAPGPILGQTGNPSPAQGCGAFGLGDIMHSTFLSPAEVGKIIWGIGPAISFPSATDDILGSGKWSAGPTAVLLTQPKPWSIGVLMGNLWSFAGDSDRAAVSQFFLQPFVSYNLAQGWFLTTAPVLTANWHASSSQRWTVPLGGGFGKLFTIGTQPLNVMLQGFGNVVRPSGAPESAMRLTVQLVFPK